MPRTPSKPLPGQVPAFTDEIPEPPTPARIRLNWMAAAAPKIRDYAVTAGEFQIAEAAAVMGIEDPPDPAHDWGYLARQMKNDGDLVNVGVARAVRRRTRKSLVHVWAASPALLARHDAGQVAA